MTTEPSNVNPFQSPMAIDMTVANPMANVEEIRKAHLNHEASVKSVGTLYLLGSIVGIMGAVGMLTVAINERSTTRAPMLIMATLFLGLSIGQGAVAFGVRSLKPWARIASVVISLIGLLGFPVGTLISAYILYLLLCQKGAYVFSEEYAQVMAATPHIQYKTSPIVIGLLVVVVAIVVLGIGVALFAG